MTPVITIGSTNQFNKSTFTLSGVNTSFANALRRTILSEIPVVVFKTGHADDASTFLINTSRLNNELVKQRLSCIPINLDPREFPLERLLLEVDVTNDTDSIMYVTSEHFKIKDSQSGEYVIRSKLDEIFPPFSPTGGAKYYIDLVRLRPRISEHLPGERIKFSCKFGVGTAREDACYNVASICSYGFTVNEQVRDLELTKKVQEWRSAGETSESIAFLSANWKLLDGMRLYVENSFDFQIQSCCFYTNDMLMVIACNVLINKMQVLNDFIQKDEISITPSKSTMANSYDIILEHEDYTVGKMLEYLLYSKFFINLKILTYCGFKKMHPHDNQSLLRLAYKEPIDANGVKINLASCVEDIVRLFNAIKSTFSTKK
jgi:DNA-directed RNA polymerase subunit L